MNAETNIAEIALYFAGASAFISAVALAINAWQFRRNGKSAELQALQTFFRDVTDAEHEVAARAPGNRRDQLAKLMNLFEIYALAHNERMIFGRGCRRFVRDKLVDVLAVFHGAETLLREIDSFVETDTTFAELMKFSKKHLRRIARRIAMLNGAEASRP